MYMPRNIFVVLISFCFIFSRSHPYMNWRPWKVFIFSDEAYYQKRFGKNLTNSAEKCYSFGIVWNILPPIRLKKYDRLYDEKDIVRCQRKGVFNFCVDHRGERRGDGFEEKCSFQANLWLKAIFFRSWRGGRNIGGPQKRCRGRLFFPFRPSQGLIWNSPTI